MQTVKEMKAGIDEIMEITLPEAKGILDTTMNKSDQRKAIRKDAYAWAECNRETKKQKKTHSQPLTNDDKNMKRVQFIGMKDLADIHTEVNEYITKWGMVSSNIRRILGVRMHQPTIRKINEEEVKRLFTNIKENKRECEIAANDNIEYLAMVKAMEEIGKNDKGNIEGIRWRNEEVKKLAERWRTGYLTIMKPPLMEKWVTFKISPSEKIDRTIYENLFEGMRREWEKQRYGEFSYMIEETLTEMEKKFIYEDMEMWHEFRRITVKHIVQSITWNIKIEDYEDVEDLFTIRYLANEREMESNKIKRKFKIIEILRRNKVKYANRAMEKENRNMDVRKEGDMTQEEADIVERIDLEDGEENKKE
ncbi:hypothetical protein SNEBB_009826 [Seison nebaliae]|nr:hypothetical protein SNEBB_009826 [Seison nebaliae]